MLAFLMLAAVVPSVARADAPILNYLYAKTDPITPYNSGSVAIAGNATHIENGQNEAMIVTVSANDGVTAYTVSTTAKTLQSDDPGTGRKAGDFTATLGITDLGTHDGTESPVYVTAYTTSKVDGKSQPLTITVWKRSASANDVYAPQLTIPSPRNGPTGPPALWCHISTAPDGNCEAIGTTPNHAVLPTCPFSIGGYPCKVPLTTGMAQIQGYAADNTSASLGIASEIKDIVVQALDSTHAVFKEYHSYIRRGTTAWLSVNMFIKDYPPGDYTFVVYAIDAVGNRSAPWPSAAGKSFRVEPDELPK